jgi:hypothetical protein
LKEGIVDSLGGLPEALAFIDEYKLVQRARIGLNGKSAYSALKQEMYRETIADLESSTEESIRGGARALQLAREKKAKEEKVREWERRRSKL